ncbi:MAG: hypothetical protein JWL97_3628, partial [Gemmatimonadales bacterium]|nr:hypothetical protein [Gemmatimonadales bacterium]
MASGPGSVAVGRDNTGIVSTGVNATNIQTVLPAQALRPVTEVVAPPRLVNVPFHSQVFVGRGGELAGMEAALAEVGGVVVAAVHGLGGVGKSTLAARYAASHADRLNPVWWITADTAAALEAGLAALAAALQPELARAVPLETLAQRATAWLAAHQGWLLVLDNVTDPAHVAPVLGRTLTGRVVVTSRLGEGWHRLGAQTLRLGVLTEEQAVDLLTQIAARDRPAADLDGGLDLVRELGCLPLAVEQAAAYLHQTHTTPRGYLDLLAQHPAVMYDQAAHGADAERTIARIWRVTLDHLADIPLVGRALRVLAWYAAEAIPRGLLKGLAEGPQLQQALGSLAAYNMITLDGDTIVVHRLVQAVARTPDPGDPHRQDADIHTACQHATTLLDQALPAYRDPAGWPAWRRLLPHIDALTGHAPADTDTATTDRLLNNTGLFLRDQGTVGRAITYHQRSLTASQRLHGEDHPDTLASRSNLAYAYESAGGLGRAIPLYEQTLT